MLIFKTLQNKNSLFLFFESPQEESNRCELRVKCNTVLLMKRLCLVLFILFLLVGQGGREAKSQNVTVLPSGITPSPAGAIPRISYEAIMALPTPQGGDLAYDLTFNVMRMYNGKNWLIMAANNPKVWGSAVFSALSTQSLFCRGAAADNAGNIYLIGEFYVSVSIQGITLVAAGNYLDVFIAKFNRFGALQWLRRGGAGGTTTNDSGNDIAVDGSGNVYSDSGKDIGVDGSGNVYVTGNINGTANFNTPTSMGSNELVSASGSDVFVAKYNTSGVVQWLRRAGGIVSESAGGIAVDGSGNVHITGSFEGTINFNTPSSTGTNELVSIGGPDVFIAKYNTSGTVQWLRRGGSVAALGNTDSGRGIAVDGSGNVYVTGTFRNTANFNTPSSVGSNELESAGLEDIFIAQYSNSGTLQWLQRAGGGQSEGASGIALGANGGANSMLYVVGTYQSITQLGVTELHNPSRTAGFLIFIKR